MLSWWVFNWARNCLCSQQGLVHGRPIAMSQTPSQPDDGGFGSVASLLLQAFGGEGGGPWSLNSGRIPLLKGCN
jgi:hypothetical protein